MLVAACSNLRDPYEDYFEEYLCLLEDFTLTVVSWVLNAHADLIQWFDDQFVQEVSPVCKLFENLVTLRDCIVEHLVQHFDGCGICAVLVH